MPTEIKKSYNPIHCAPRPPLLFAPVSYYMAICSLQQSGIATPININTHYNCRDKTPRRYNVAAEGAMQSLSVPITGGRSTSLKTWNDVIISDHGNWQHVHLATLKTLYGRSPFFDYIIDRFGFMFSPYSSNTRFVDMVVETEKEINKLLLLDAPMIEDQIIVSEANNTFHEVVSKQAVPEYYQTTPCRCEELSILDLLFNCGKESALIIRCR